MSEPYNTNIANPTDTTRIILVKILNFLGGVLVAQGGTLTNNNTPNPTDTVAILIQKLLNLISSLSWGGAVIGGAVLKDTVDPVGPPIVGSILFVNITTGNVWYNDGTAVWHPLL